MKRVFILGLSLTGAALLFAGVIKTSLNDNGFFITAGSKITGGGSKFTQCDYFDQNTGKFVAEKQFPGIGFDNTADLGQFCITNEPVR